MDRAAQATGEGTRHISCLALVGSHVTAEGTTVATATGKQSTEKILKICKTKPLNYTFFFLIQPKRCKHHLCWPPQDVRFKIAKSSKSSADTT